MPAVLLRYSMPGEAVGYLTYPFLGYEPSGTPGLLGPVIDFSIDTNSMYAAIISAFV
jgi:hypothetical protein